jgi:hypothetical protein
MGGSGSVYSGRAWSPELTVPGATTTADGPALAVFGTRLYVSWAGPNTDKVFYASFDGKWSTKASVPKALTGESPALAAFQGRLYDAWAGRTTDRLFYSSQGSQAAPRKADKLRLVRLTSREADKRGGEAEACKAGFPAALPAPKKI